MTAPVTPPAPADLPAPVGDPPARPVVPPTTPPAPVGDQPLGPAGEKALTAEREARKALERQLAELAPLRKLAEAIGGQQGDPAAGKVDPVAALQDRLAKHEETLAEERAARYRAEVAHEKGLTAAQAARLIGTTRDELSADADALVAAFGSTPQAKPGTPRPDLSQGAKGTGAADTEALIADARKRGDIDAVIRLQMGKSATA
jgi:hypothetical protein